MHAVLDPGVFDLEHTPIEDGITVVEASAGTGKTYCLTGLVLRLLLEERVADIGEILVVTFTRAATHELVTRLRDAVSRTQRLLRGEESTDDPFFGALAERHGDDRGRAILRRARLDLDRLAVLTIHGFCRQVLQESAFESGVDFRPEFIDDDEPLLLAAARDFWRRRLYAADSLVAAVVAEQSWTPESFAGDYRVWRRHPKTRVLPAAKPLGAAIDGLHSAVANLRRVWNHSATRTFLASLTFLKNARLDATGVAAVVGDLDAFLDEREGRGLRGGGLYAARRLAVASLTRDVRKVHVVEVERHPVCRACGEIEDAVAALEHSLRQAFIAGVDGLFDGAKQATGALAFDDLLRQVHTALEDPVRGPALASAVRGRYRAVLVDEFQDTDLIQYDIFLRLFRRGPLFLIGDPKQAIYRFRGADVFAYVEAKGDADRLYTLDRNWRSDAGLLAAVNAVFAQAPRSLIFEEIPFAPSQAADAGARARLSDDGRPPLRWMWLPRQDNKEQAGAALRQAVVAEIVALLDGRVRVVRPGADETERPLQPSDIAILVRTNDQAERIHRALREARVPAVVSRAGDIFDSDEMAELQRLLKAIVDPSSAGRARAAWATRTWGDDATALLRLDGDDDAWQDRLEELDLLRRTWHEQGFVAMIQRLIRRRGVRGRWLAAEDGERGLTNLLHAVEVLHQAILERHLSPAGLVAWLDAERASARSHDADATEIRLESDALAVQISTVHKSKGLEYSVVFCPYLWEAVPQDRKPVTAHKGPREVVYDFGSEALADHLAKAEAERLAEDLRLAYVAMTRARHRCYVVWGDVGRSSAASALGYLLRAPDPRRHPRDPPPDPGVHTPGYRMPPSGLQDGEAQPRTPEELVAEELGRVRGASGAWRLELQSLVDQHPDLMEVRDIGSDHGVGASGSAPWTPPTQALEPPRRIYLRRRLDTWRMASFSSMSQVRSRRKDLDREDLDREELDHFDPSSAVRASPDPGESEGLTGMFAFARGARAGTCLHEILEEVDFTAIEGDDVRRVVEDALSHHGLDRLGAHDPGAAPNWEPVTAVLQMLRRLCAAPMPGVDQTRGALTLGDVGLDRRLIEWRFVLPLAEMAPRRLAETFRDYGGSNHGGDGLAADYARHLRGLDERTLHGFLTGFVDLIFTDGERWYVLDWKSNDLGRTLADYGAGPILEEMAGHHYILQYHLYTLALHRYLRYRLPDYDYERHFGGAVYVFLRGVDAAGSNGATDREAGWFVDKPPERLIDALERVLIRGSLSV